MFSKSVIAMSLALIGVSSFAFASDQDSKKSQTDYLSKEMAKTDGYAPSKNEGDSTQSLGKAGRAASEEEAEKLQAEISQLSREQEQQAGKAGC